ncbi:MAG: nicotianamine synthase family protein [Myxococcota bacterium]
MRDFPYFENYVELTRLEFSVVQSFAAEPVQRALFLGSGPLALTNIVLAKYHNVLARGIDHDAPAVALSNRLSERLGIAGQVSAKHRRAESLEAKQIRAADVVYLAAMVGEDRPEKAEVLKHLHTSMQPGQLLVVRSAHRLRRLLYPAIDVDDIGGFEPLAEIHPHNDIVNSFLVLRRS